MKRWYDFFKNPIPGIGGFSPYTIPGIVVHFSIAGVFALFGNFLCDGNIALFPFFLFCLVSGLYFGRDLAIYSDYSLGLTLTVFGSLLLFFVFFPHLVVYAKSFREIIGPYFVVFGVFCTGSIFLVFAWHIRNWLREGG